MSESKYKEAYNEGFERGKKKAFDGFVYQGFDELSKREQIEMIVSHYGARLPFWDIAREPIYPLTIITDRYTGTYSGGKVLAFNVDYYELPEAIDGDDETCAEFFCNTDIIYGKGETPTEAYMDLIHKLHENGKLGERLA